ncbi:DUF6415 family natural product biosynthesis protein [Streptomyces daliensis]|uniref:Uncharacterized protein n=1 Tax=Streptomyces daliensis TaxID=299421 RepID=A0A8T4IR35_9ACTN|nr:hypothetical protein [Streptomyces daliensis]
MHAEEIKEAISRALTERSVLPPYGELYSLHETLVGHIETLMPVASQQIDGLWHGAPEWYRKRARLDAIAYEVRQGLGPGLQSAASHVRSLGYALRFLSENTGALEAGKSARS